MGKKAQSLRDVLNVVHGFLGGKNGMSLPPSQSLSASSFGRISSQDAEENKKRILKTLGAGDSLLMMRQVHGSDVCVVTNENLDSLMQMPPCVDGVVTGLKGVALGVLTADCAPLLWVAPDASIVGACHAGWRGTYARVLLKKLLRICAF